MHACMLVCLHTVSIPAYETPRELLPGTGTSAILNEICCHNQHQVPRTGIILIGDDIGRCETHAHYRCHFAAWDIYADMTCVSPRMCTSTLLTLYLGTHAEYFMYDAQKGVTATLQKMK